MNKFRLFTKLVAAWLLIGWILWGIGILLHNTPVRAVGMCLVFVGAIVQLVVGPRYAQDQARRMEIQQRVPGLNDDPSTWPSGECDLILESAGERPIYVIRALREIYVLALRDASNMVRSTPVVLKRGISFAEAEFVKSKVEAAGAKVGIVPSPGGEG